MFDEHVVDAACRRSEDFSEPRGGVFVLAIIEQFDVLEDVRPRFATGHEVFVMFTCTRCAGRLAWTLEGRVALCTAN